jgi:hypothetical protein
MRPLERGDGGPSGRVKRCFHPKGGNVPEIGRLLLAVLPY